MRVQELMTRNVKSCNPGTNLAEAATLLWDNDCGVLPVINTAENVVGVISDRDICVAVATKRRLASEITVGEIIEDHTVYSCAPEDELQEALRTMQQQQVRRLPVVDREGKLQGILSINDVILSAEKKGKTVSFEDTVTTLKSICAPRDKTVSTWATKAKQI